jgi:hypothetical protein
MLYLTNLQWIRPHTSEDGLVRHDRLENTIGLTDSQPIAAKVVGINNVYLAILSRCYAHTCDASTGEGSWV